MGNVAQKEWVRDTNIAQGQRMSAIFCLLGAIFPYSIALTDLNNF